MENKEMVHLENMIRQQESLPKNKAQTPNAAERALHAAKAEALVQFQRAVFNFHQQGS